MSADPDLRAHYDLGAEHARLTGPGALEYERTLDLLSRVLPAEGEIFDVGGGTGRYAVTLAKAGRAVRLLDLMPLHIETARLHAAEQGVSLAEARVGDALALPWADGSASAALLLGPLYHLTEEADRLRALAEARRVLRPGGVVIAAGISRFASALDGIASRHVEAPAFRAILAADLASGQHRNPANHPAWFTTAFFHRPEELRAELVLAGFSDVRVYAVEGPAWLVRDLPGREENPLLWAEVLAVLRQIEEEPALLGASAHLLAVGRRG